ncbi:set1/ash2 histone methyltransferase complex subunit ash2-like [Plakobranchus ocellatus]|uniref:Set1/ash2 histone methyltransferase complex subunit ash2-like n=1 Tax=Plakobranchus ocellatus TaxID=259542 RepID=A0AAV4ACG7_9GAST|nr:set1/ash2 histone methyltransferase complex subunit ash2-like [Plakobranchus ocellatus]
MSSGAALRFAGRDTSVTGSNPTSTPSPDIQGLEDCHDLPLVKFKSHLYFEDKDNVSESEKALKQAKGSKIMMFKNGVSAGVAFSDLFEGTYFPAISLYKNTTVTANFGPKFHFPPKQIDFKPMSAAAEQAHIEYALADIVYHVENEDNIPDFL